MDYTTIRVDHHAREAHVTLNRPPVNVINLSMIDELNVALDKITSNPDVTTIVFRGAGDKAFSTGVDIKDHTLDKINSMLKSFHHVFRTLANSDKITVASVHGYCLGGGMELATFCDFVIASDSTIFGQPEIKVGCYPPVAAAWLPQKIGFRRAMEICMLGENITAHEALSLGLINKVVPPDELPSATDTLLQNLNALSGTVLKQTKRALLAGADKPFTTALDTAENIYLQELVKTHDIEEGITAFMQKRKPEWKHR